MRAVLIFALTGAALSGCGGDDQHTLYRNSIADAGMRIHVASFDANEGAAYNSSNCMRAAVLFQQQPKVDTRFWCEAGRFKK